MSAQPLEFVASMTVCPSDIHKIQHHLELAQPKVNPLSSILVTPLFIHNGSMELARQLAEKGANVFFDSGGYYVQIGRLKYEELYMPLLQAYKTSQWAQVYTLPDHVPTTQDTPEEVEQKVRNTITFSTLFYQEMPDDLKPRAMPVVQGHTLQQIERCLEAYLSLGVQRIGFGSFGTAGQNSEINVATENAVALARHVIQVAHEHGIKVHLFGIGRPALLAMVKGIEADSFDSSSWLKAAGFGQVFLPFMRGYNITYNTHISQLERSITFKHFRALVSSTGHECRLCSSLVKLQTSKMHRAVHNLIAVAETVDMLNNGDYEQIKQIYENGSPKYRNEFGKWLA
jgi:hypothetical protein